MNSQLLRNPDLIEELDREIHLLPSIPLSDAEREEGAEFIERPGSFPTLQVRDGQGKRLTLHSPANALEEARKIVARILPVRPDSILILLGLGLGYHLKEVIRKIQPGQTVIIVEQSQAVWEQALRHTDLTEYIRMPNFYWLIHPDEKVVLQNISRIQLRYGLHNFALLVHAASCRFQPQFYGNLVQQVEAARKVNIRDHLRYKKFGGEKARILILNTRYFLVGEIMRTLSRMGHLGHWILIEDQEVGQDEILGKIMQAIISFQPDFVLSVNHLGFDVEGVLTQFFTSIELPFASWYVDSPTLIVRHYKKNRSPFLSVFLWDRDYLRDMKNLGMEKVYYLPLATDIHIFRPLPARENKWGANRYSITFVGNSMVQAVRKYLSKLGENFPLLPLFEELSAGFMHSEKRHVYEILEPRLREGGNPQSISQEEMIHFEAAITWQATLKYRLKTLQALASLHPHIFGDEGWHALLNGEFFLHAGVSYTEDLPSLYNLTEINFNATSLQMKNGVNQRAFDVPACGKFLLTDYRDQIGELFKVGEEVICYHDDSEALDLAKFYLRHAAAREKIAAAARKRIIQEHGYTHRLNFLIERMREDYA